MVFRLEDNHYILTALKTDKEIRNFFGRNRVPLPKVKERAIPEACSKIILDFLSQHKLDQKMHRYDSDYGCEITIFLNHRNSVTHSG